VEQEHPENQNSEEKMSKKLSVLLALVVIFTMVMAACAPTEEPSVVEPTAETPAETEPTAVVEEPTAVPEAVDASAKPLKIYAVQHALCAWDSFWCTVEAGIKQAATDMGVDVTILGPDKFDLEKTAQLIEQAVAAKPDGLAVTVTDADLFRASFRRRLTPASR